MAILLRGLVAVFCHGVAVWGKLFNRSCCEVSPRKILKRHGCVAASQCRYLGRTVEKVVKNAVAASAYAIPMAPLVLLSNKLLYY